jgi:pimeloyl-ACP methyl ester carboxylesterase
MIRGESRTNPPLILLYGGPGLSETPFFRRFNAPLEKTFTVVYWDQRGSGKSFDRKIPRASMTVEQFIVDLDELVEAVLDRVGRKKVTILGHSWGSALGVLYAARFPEKVAAYVGTAQVGGRRPSRHRTPSHWPKRNVSTTAGRGRSCAPSGRHPTTPRAC